MGQVVETLMNEKEIGRNLVDSVLTLSFISFPMYLLLVPPASISLACEDLFEKLNMQRANPDTAVHLRVQHIKSFLTEANKGQGIGLVLFGIVISKDLLIQLFTKMVVSSFAIFTLAHGMAGTESRVDKAIQNQTALLHLLQTEVCALPAL